MTNSLLPELESPSDELDVSPQAANVQHIKAVVPNKIRLLTFFIVFLPENVSTRLKKIHRGVSQRGLFPPYFFNHYLLYDVSGYKTSKFNLRFQQKRLTESNIDFIFNIFTFYIIKSGV